MTTRKLGTCISTQICFACTMSPSQCKPADLFGPRLFACCLVVTNTKMKLTGGKESPNPTCHVTFLFFTSTLQSPRSVIFHASTIRCCHMSWPKPEAGKPLCRQMSSFVRRLGILRAQGRPMSSCVDIRLVTNSYTANDSHCPYLVIVLSAKRFVSTKLKQGKHRDA